MAGVWGLIVVFASGAAGWEYAVPAVLSAVALATRRLSVPVMVVCAVAMGATQLATGTATPGADLVYPVLFHTLGRHPDRRWRTVGLAAATVASLVGGAWFGREGAVDTGQRAFTIAILTVVCAAFSVGGWVSGYLRLQRQAGVRARIEARLAEAEQRRLNQAFEAEQERARIAADMHDVVAHSWAVVAAQADGARYALRTSPEAAEQALEVIAETARSTMGDLRVILARLRHQQTEETLPGREQQAALLARMRASGMTLEVVEVAAVEESVEAPASALLVLTAHRLLGEALTNALKHGDLTHPVRVEQDWSAGYRLRVSNALASHARPPGAGHRRSDGTGHGLIGMTERAEVAGGRLIAGPEGDLWVVTAELPPTAASPADGVPEEASDDRDG